MPKWKVIGYDGDKPIGFERQISGSATKVCLLLERLAARI